MSTATLSRPKAQRTWTYDEFAGESAEINLPTELWDGEIVTAGGRPPRHQIVVANAWSQICRVARSKLLGEVLAGPLDVVLSPRRVVQPDVLFVSAARKSIVESTCIRGVPELLVEVISEGTWRRDRVDKKALYEQFGVAEYWIIDPDSRLIEVFTLAKGTYQLHARGVGAEKVSSKLLAGMKVSFEQLEA